MPKRIMAADVPSFGLGQIGRSDRAIDDAGASMPGRGSPCAGRERAAGPEQAAPEMRARMPNPKWHAGLLGHGCEGVRRIEARPTNTVGWSAAAKAVQPWTCERITQTFVLDPAVRQRMASLDPAASAKVVRRLIEANHRCFRTPDAQMRDALDRAEEGLEDRLEGVTTGIAA